MSINFCVPQPTLTHFNSLQSILTNTNKKLQSFLIWTHFYELLPISFEIIFILLHFNQFQLTSTYFNQFQSTSIHFNQFQPTLTKKFKFFQFQSIFVNFYQSPSKLFSLFYTLNNVNQLLLLQSTSINFNPFQITLINFNQH